MLHFAANYIFDGEELIKNSLVTTNAHGEILFVGKQDDAFIERPRMIFYNGIITPLFINFNSSIDDKKHISEISYQNQALADMKKFMKNYNLKEILQMFTKNSADTIGWNDIGRLKEGKSPGIILLENVDLINLKIKDNTFVKKII